MKCIRCVFTTPFHDFTTLFRTRRPSFDRPVVFFFFFFLFFSFFFFFFFFFFSFFFLLIERVSESSLFCWGIVCCVVDFCWGALFGVGLLVLGLVAAPQNIFFLYFFGLLFFVGRLFL